TGQEGHAQHGDAVATDEHRSVDHRVDVVTGPHAPRVVTRGTGRGARPTRGTTVTGVGDARQGDGVAADGHRSIDHRVDVVTGPDGVVVLAGAAGGRPGGARPAARWTVAALGDNASDGVAADGHRSVD